MSCYVILDIDVKDTAGYEEYKKQGAATLAAFGARPVARGGRTEVLEGDWQPKRVVMIEFGSMEEARRWWDSPEYKEAKKLRHRSARTNAVIIDGL
jgi:uncharacterized protein (DUF1330 family)